MLFLGAAPGARQWPNALCEACIGKIAGGDSEALGTLYENTKDAVYGFALSIVQNPQDAEDVLQDTYVSIYLSSQSYKRLGKPMAWVLTIARNLSLMKLRGRQRTAGPPKDGQDLFGAAPHDTTSEDRLVLTAALGAVGPQESQIVMLHAVAGLKHREIAGLLEMPLSTVLSKYNRAVKKLKLVLEEAGAYV